MGFYPVIDVMLPMYSGGITTAVVDMGAVNPDSPIYESYIINYAFNIYDVGGLFGQIFCDLLTGPVYALILE